MRTTEPTLDRVSILLIFLMAAILAIFCLSLLTIIIRKSLSLRNFRVYRVFLYIMLYIVARLAICTVVIVEILYGISNNWKELSGDQIQLLFKDSLIFGEAALVGLFLVVFEQYLVICLKLTRNSNPTVIMRFKRVLQGTQTVYFLVMAILFALFNCKVIKFEIFNIVALSLNLLLIICFVTSFFYLSFLMTGVMLSKSKHEKIKKIYKYLLVLLFSRFINCGLDFVIAIEVSDGSFRGFINIIEENRDTFIIQCIIFIGYLLFILLSQGIEMMYSLKKNTIELFCGNLDSSTNLRETGQIEQNFIVSSGQGIEDMLKSNFETGTANIKSLDCFVDIIPINEIKSQVWDFYKGQYRARFYFIRKAVENVSNYIIQQVAQELDYVRSKNIREINPMNHFINQNFLFLFQPFRQTNLSQKVSKCNSFDQKVSLMLKVALGIQKMHEVSIVHGALNPRNIFIVTGIDENEERISFSGYGLRPLRRYLAMTTEYTNKTCFTAVEHLRERNSIVMKPTKESDIYSFGMILYEVATGVTNYRSLTIKQLQQKLSVQKTRPKIPDQCHSKLKQLIRKCWQDDPLSRPPISSVVFDLTALIEQ